MRPFRIVLLLVALAICALTVGVSTRSDRPATAQTTTASTDSRTEAPPQTIPDRYIVTFHDDVAADAYASVLETSPDVAIGERYDAAIDGFAADMPAEIAAALDADPAVKFIEPDRIVRVDTETLPTGINRIDVEPAGDINAIGPDTDVDVAIIDTGIDIDHPDLRVAGGFTSYGFDFFFFQICGQTDTFDDGHGHGTHVGGTVGARDNDQGVIGVAPGARLWAIRVLGPEGSGCLSDVIAGVDYVTANTATIEVANMSIESPDSPSLCTAINNSVASGVIYAVASGNSGIDAAQTTPANCSSVITTSAVADYNGIPGGGAAPTCANNGADDALAVFSNYGAVVDVAAPGVCILSTYIGGGYATFSGTSMASPHMAGAAARFVAEGYGGSATGSAVLSAMNAAGWLEPQGGPCGFSGDPDAFHEPMLHPGAVCSPGLPTATPTNTLTPSPTLTPSLTPTPTWTPGGPTATFTNTPTATNTPTITPTFTPTSTPIPAVAQAISAGGFHTCALTSAGGVRCWGQNDSGQLGDGTNTNRTTPVDVSALGSGLIAVSAGGNHTCALTSAGGVKCWGLNANGQLGDGTTANRTTPVDVSGLTSGVAAISAGGYHSCAVMTSGGVKCWGRNDRGQLGDNSATQRLTPANVFGLASGMVGVAAGGSDAQGGHTCALTSGGAVKCWGRNDFGQVGDGSTADRFVPVDVAGITSGANAIGAGRYHSCGQMAAGGVKCWGWDIFGQLGNGGAGAGTTPVDVIDLPNAAGLSVGGLHSCVRTSSGGAKCWGNNGGGQIGDGSIGNTRASPVNVLVSPGGAALSGVVAIAAGGNVWPDGQSCAVTITVLKCWGLNGSGQVGDGTTANRTTPVDVIGFVPPTTPTPGPTATSTPPPTATNTSIPTGTNTPPPTATNTALPTATNTPPPTATNTALPTATNTALPTATNTPLPTATNTALPTATNTSIPTASNTPILTATNTPLPTSTNTSIPTATNTPIPTATNTPVPTATNTPVPTSTNTPLPTATNSPSPPTPTPTAGPVLYFALEDDGTVGGLAAANEDIVAWNGAQFTTLFDGSDVGLGGFAVDAFTRAGVNQILMSFSAPGTVPGIAGTVDDSDIVRFIGVLGPNTSGSFSLYFDGSDVGLTTDGEDVDTIEQAGGKLLLSTTGGASLPGGLLSADEDVLEFTATSLGANTVGTWATYFDGGDVGLTAGGEDVDGMAVVAGKIYLTTDGAFSVPGVSGENEDIFVFTPSSLGPTTAGTYATALFFDGSLFALAGNDVNAIDVP